MAGVGARLRSAGSRCLAEPLGSHGDCGRAKRYPRGTRDRLATGQEVPRALQEAPESQKCSILAHLSLMFCCFSAFLFRCVFKLCFCPNFILLRPLFRSARKRPTCEKRNTLHAKTCFFKVRSRAGAASKAKKTMQKTTPKNIKNMMKFVVFCSFFLAVSPSCKNAL